jgi:hypothetical protein
MSIAIASFVFVRRNALIKRMQTIADTRRQRLALLIKEHGSLAALNEKLELPRTDATLSQIKNQSPHHKTGKPRSMGDDLARKIEEKLNKPTGWMDTPPSYLELQGEPDPKTQLLAVMEHLPADQYATAIRLMAALVGEDPTKSKNHH